jgi:hypothetical protein
MAEITKWASSLARDLDAYQQRIPADLSERNTALAGALIGALKHVCEDIESHPAKRVKVTSSFNEADWTPQPESIVAQTKRNLTLEAFKAFAMDVPFKQYLRSKLHQLVVLPFIKYLLSILLIGANKDHISSEMVIDILDTPESRITKRITPRTLVAVFVKCDCCGAALRSNYRFFIAKQSIDSSTIDWNLCDNCSNLLATIIDIYDVFRHSTTEAFGITSGVSSRGRNKDPEATYRFLMSQIDDAGEYS